MSSDIQTPLGDAPLIPVLLISVGGYVAWFAVHYWRDTQQKYPSDPLKAFLTGKGLPKPARSGSITEELKNFHLSAGGGAPAAAAAGGGGTAQLGGPGPGGISAADWTMAQQAGGRYGVDPYLLVAIGFHETGWGTEGDGRPPPAGHGNVLGVGSFDSGSVSTWSGLSAQLNEGAKILSQHGVHTIGDVQAGKATWWATDPAWAAGVSAQYLRIHAGR